MSDIHKLNITFYRKADEAKALLEVLRKVAPSARMGRATTRLHRDD